jgi:hypothetical protein
VLAEQNLQIVVALADRVYILEKGEVRFIGTLADLQADKSIVQQFLTNDGAGLIAASLVDPDRQGAWALSPATPLKGGPWDGERWIRVSNPPPLAPVRTVSPA